MTGRTPSSRSALIASAEVSRGASAIAMTAAALPSMATCTLVRPSPASSSERAASPSRATPSRSSRRALPTARRWPSTVASSPWPGTASKVSARGICRPRLDAALTIACASGCSLSPSAAATRRSTSLSLEAVGGRDGDDLGLAARERAGLVEDDRVERGGLLEGDRVLEQDAALGAQAGADHDRRRRGQPEGVRAGDDDDGDREQQRVLDVAADEEVPDDEGQRAADERDQHEPEGGAVGQALSRRLGVLRLLDELDDLRERGVRADGGRAGAQGAVLVDGRADELIAGGLLHGQALAGDRRLVDLALAVLDHGVDGDLGSRADEQQVADLDLGGRDLDGFAVAQDDGLRWREVQQRAHRVVGAAAGAHLEPVAEQHEGGEHARGLVEDLAFDEECRGDRVQPARCRSPPPPAPSCPASCCAARRPRP